MADAERQQQRQGFLYVDTSALVKLLVREAESEALEVELLGWPKLATSIITEVELPRAVARAREDRPDAVIDGSVVLQGILASATIVSLDESIVDEARLSRLATRRTSRWQQPVGRGLRLQSQMRPSQPRAAREPVPREDRTRASGTRRSPPPRTLRAFRDVLRWLYVRHEATPKR